MPGNPGHPPRAAGPRHSYSSPGGVRMGPDGSASAARTSSLDRRAERGGARLRGLVCTRRSDAQPPRNLRGPCRSRGGEVTTGRARPALTTRERGGWCTESASASAARHGSIVPAVSGLTASPACAERPALGDNQDGPPRAWLSSTGPSACRCPAGGRRAGRAGSPRQLGGRRPDLPGRGRGGS
jgi:hypothetical protein